MVTINDLHNGLVINCAPKQKFNEDYLYEIQSLEKGILYSKLHDRTYDGYLADTILDRINRGIWSIHKFIHEVW